MNCPPDYICNATPAWVVMGILGGMVVLVILLVAVLAWFDR